MGKAKIIVAISLLCWGTSYAQSGWFALNSGTNERLVSACFPDSNTGYIVGFNHIALKTTNSGINWFQQIVSSGDVLRSVSFLNANTGYIAFGNFNNIGGIFKTTNGGTNWISLTVPNNYYYKIYFINAATGFASGWQIISKTTDAGTTWSSQTFSELGYITSIYFVDVVTGYASEFNSHKILKTSNGGSVWQEIYTYTGDGGFFDIHFTDINTGFAVGGDATLPGNPLIFRTTNGGLNWINLNFSSNIHYFYDVNFINGNSGFITGGSVGIAGMLLKTTNGGSNWYVQLNLNDFISSTCFTNLNTGYAVGAQGRILKTTDGGGNFVGISPVVNEIPTVFKLYQNYPNPFNPSTKIRFEISNADMHSNVSLLIYDVLGRKVSTLVNKQVKPGTYEAEWDGSNYPSGIYYCKLSSGDYEDTRRMILIK